jgi:hypothetical protein
MMVDVSTSGIVARTSAWESDLLPTMPPEPTPSSPTPIPTTTQSQSRSGNSGNGPPESSPGPTTSTVTGGPEPVLRPGEIVSLCFDHAGGRYQGKGKVVLMTPSGSPVVRPEGWKHDVMVSPSEIL